MEETELERMFVRSGIRLFKTGSRSRRIKQDKQVRRFKARETDPLERWNLSPVDKASQGIHCADHILGLSLYPDHRGDDPGTADKGGIARLLAVSLF